MLNNLELQKLRNTYEARSQDSNVSSSSPPPPPTTATTTTQMDETISEPFTNVIQNSGSIEDNKQNDDESMLAMSMDQSGLDRSHLNKLNKLSDLTINEHLTDEELMNMYKESEILEEQADILHYLFYNK